MSQRQHKAAASVLRLAQATWRGSVSLKQLPTNQVMKESAKMRVIIVTFQSGRGLCIHCKTTFNLDASDVIYRWHPILIHLLL